MLRTLVTERKTGVVHVQADGERFNCHPVGATSTGPEDDPEVKCQLCRDEITPE